MKRLYRIFPLLLTLLLLLGGCGGSGRDVDYLTGGLGRSGDSITEVALITQGPAQPTPELTEIIDAPPDATLGPDWTVSYDPGDGTVTYRPPAQPEETAVSTVPDPGPGGELLHPGETVPPKAAEAERAAWPSPSPEPESETSVGEDGEYTAPEDVAEYLHLYGHLPGNFITKKEAQALGWPGGNLWKYAPGKSIGGDYFGNYEGLLPKGSYHECDVNYSGGSRGAERLIYGSDGSIYYTNDHYNTFTQLY